MGGQSKGAVHGGLTSHHMAVVVVLLHEIEEGNKWGVLQKRQVLKQSSRRALLPRRE
jgi:hypothetical protein